MVEVGVDRQQLFQALYERWIMDRQERMNRDINNKLKALHAMKRWVDKDENARIRVIELEQEIDDLVDALHEGE